MTPRKFLAQFDAAPRRVSFDFDSQAQDEAVADVTEQLAAGKQLVPSHLWGGILNHVLEGRGTGNFLTGLFENDLLKAACGADDVALERIRDLALFMHNYAPQGCWGSTTAVKRWREAGGIRGGAHLLETEPVR